MILKAGTGMNYGKEGCEKSLLSVWYWVKRKGILQQFSCYRAEDETGINGAQEQ